MKETKKQPMELKKETKGTMVYGFTDDDGREWAYYFPKDWFPAKPTKITVTISA